ncbi:hypothetical protein FDECE_8226 [Fusarium decemcellulare]|nr:hypothetical protein FDECE_8226 [Fusarium decemcellulare]
MLSLIRSFVFLPLILHSFIASVAANGHHGRTKEFDLKVTWEEHAPDGFSRQMLLVNGQSPGPVLEIDQDDWVVVHVHNYSPENITVHYHGIEMKGTPWSDGVPGVTQHPIEPGCSFTYKFEATQHGSYWYHSHFRGQIEDGLFGPIVIHPRSDEPNPFHLITEDADTLCALEEAEKSTIPLVISDFVHLTSDEKWKMTIAAGVEDSCYDSVLINGKGRVECLSKEVIEENLNDIQKAYLAAVPGAEMTDKACLPASALLALGGGGGNESALLPGTFSGCKETEGQIEVIKISENANWISIDVVGGINFINGVFSIDGHDLWVYSMDGSYIEPQKVQAISVANGDRYSVFVKVDKAGDFKIRFNANSAPQLITGQAILSVEGYGYDRPEEAEAYINLVGLPTSKEVVFFNQNKAFPYPPDPISPTADVTFNLSMKIDGATYLWALNDTRLMPAELDVRKPTLFHPQPYVHNNVTISTKLDEWVDLVLIASMAPQPPHPIHKHGTKMYQIGAGTGVFRWSSVEEAVKEIPDQFNLVNPPRRDAFASLPAEKEPTWVVVRYHASNPGPWLLHCHINNHMVGGMMMVIQDGVDHWPIVPDEYAEGRQGQGNGYVLNLDIKKILQTATPKDEGGCGLCSLIRWSLRNSVAKIKAMHKPTIALYRNPPCNNPIQQIDVIVAEKELEELAWAHDVTGLWHLGPPDGKPWITRGRIILYADHERSQSEDPQIRFKFRRVEDNSGSIACFDLASQWLSDCLRNHEGSCPSNATSPLPTRLIDVGPSDGSEPPRLITANPGQRGKYIALSYCWGKNPFFALTSANKADLEKCIPMEKLSRTIRDTIVVTRRLGVRYVWIDSLCIIQGTNDEAVKDWEQEAQHMGSIFRGAFVTLTAAGSIDAHQGLLNERENLTRSYHALPLDRDSGNIVFLGRETTGVGTAPASEPLSRRGWVYQESFLSIRALSYESKELSWKCRASNCRESLIKSSNLSPEASKRDKPDNIRQNWKSMVEDYSSRSLTFPSDKLPAIAGLAKMAQQGSPNEYMFGVWTDQLLEFLLWQHLGHSIDGKRFHTCQAKRRAPSWSWASVDGRVKFLNGAKSTYTQIKGMKDESILIKGYLRNVRTLRLEVAASYYGGYDNYQPWARLPTTMKTYLDSLDTIPSRHQRKETKLTPRELVDVWLLYLGPSCGLILVEAHQMQPPERRLFHTVRQAFQEYRSFVRLGSFVGYPIEKKQSARFLLM